MSFTADPAIRNRSKFLAAGFGLAAWVPLRLGEGPAFVTLRPGLFGLDKPNDVEGTVTRLKTAAGQVPWKADSDAHSMISFEINGLIFSR